MIDERYQVVEFDNCTVVRETDKAFLIEIEGEEHWIPKSQISTDYSEIADGGMIMEGMLAIPRWLAEEKGLY